MKPTFVMFLYKRKRNPINLYKCGCGALFECCLYDVIRAKRATKSCGCLKQKSGNQSAGGLSRKEYETYKVYAGMIKRCNNPKNANYEYYGGRGIMVCFDWLGKDGFVHFLRDMKRREPGMSLDRIDNEGHYEPDNCRWIPIGEQSGNRRWCVKRTQTTKGELVEPRK